MQRKILSLLCAFLTISLCLSNGTSFSAAATDRAWVLTEIVSHEYAERWTTADEHPSYAVKRSYAVGAYSASTKYEGDDSYKKGTLGLKAVFTGVPSVIYPDQPVSLNLSFSTTENSVVNLSFSGWASADFDQWDVGAGSRTGGSVPFANAAGKDSFTISSANEPYSYNETLTAKLGAGTDGSRIALRTKFSMGAPMGTNFVYVWKSVSEAALVVPPPAEPGSEPDASTPTTPTPQPPVSPPPSDYSWWWKSDDKAEEPSKPIPLNARIVRFGDIHGEVNVKRYDEDDDAWVYAELGTPLRHGDMIRTLPNSGAILSFSDMSTFVMKPDTVIILDIANERESKIGVVAGTIWTNFKKMVNDGTMEVEMAQAVAGIKGTTFICETVNGVSTLKVFEGTVTYTARGDGKTVMVGGGQMITASDDGLSKVTSFDVTAELASWDDSVKAKTTEAVAASKKKSSLMGPIIITGILVIAGLFAFAFITAKRRKTRPRGAVR